MTLRLQWRKTWEDRSADFVGCLPDGKSVCRVYFSAGSQFRTAEWYWTCNGRYRGRAGSASGHADSKNEAARKAEQARFAMVERADRKMGPP